MLDLLQPFVISSAHSLSTDPQFSQDRHQPFLHILLSKLLYYIQFPMGDEHPEATPLWTFRPSFDQFCLNLAALADKRTGTYLQPSTMLLLLWGQFGDYLERTTRTIPTEMQWLCTYELAVECYNIQFPDITVPSRPFPFPDFRPHLATLLPPPRQPKGNLVNSSN